MVCKMHRQNGLTNVETKVLKHRTGKGRSKEQEVEKHFKIYSLSLLLFLLAGPPDDWMDGGYKYLTIEDVDIY